MPGGAQPAGNVECRFHGEYQDAGKRDDGSGGDAWVAEVLFYRRSKRSGGSGWEECADKWRSGGEVGSQSEDVGKALGGAVGFVGGETLEVLLREGGFYGLDAGNPENAAWVLGSGG